MPLAEWQTVPTEQLAEISAKRQASRLRRLKVERTHANGSDIQSNGTENNGSPPTTALKKVCPFCNKPNALSVVQCRPCSFPLSEWDTQPVSVNPFLAVISGEDKVTNVLYRDSEIILFDDRFGVSGQHIQCISTTPFESVTELSQNDIPLLERFYELAVKELESRNLPLFESRSIRKYVVAGYNIPGSVEHLHLHMVLPPFRHENVFEYPRWHSQKKILSDLRQHNRVINYHEAPQPHEGREVYDDAIRNHRELLRELESAEGSSTSASAPKTKPFRLNLYAVTDSTMAAKQGFSLAAAVEASIRGGATLVQIREKECSHEEFVKRAREVLSVCRQYSVPLIINDSVQVMLEVDADGVHIGQDDGDPRKVREKIGAGKILGISACTRQQAQKAIADGADYLGSGAMFASPTKPDKPVLGPSGVKKIISEECRKHDIPVVAIGGITANNVHELRNTGVSGVAIISGIFAQSDIAGASASLRRAVEVFTRPQFFPRTYAITSNPTDADIAEEFRSYVAKVETMIRSRGIELLQLRAKTLDCDSYLKLSSLVLPICLKYACRMLLNGDYSLLRSLPKASGIHLTSNQLHSLASASPNRSTQISASLLPFHTSVPAPSKSLPSSAQNGSSISSERKDESSCESTGKRSATEEPSASEPSFSPDLVWDKALPLVGASCHTREDLLIAEALPVDFAVLSPVKRTSSHPEAQPLGWDRFQELTNCISIPVYALGGLDADNDADAARRYGAHGVAAISSLWPKS